MDGLSLLAVGSACVGSPVFTADGNDGQAAIAHLRREVTPSASEKRINSCINVKKMSPLMAVPTHPAENFCVLPPLQFSFFYFTEMHTHAELNAGTCPMRHACFGTASLHTCIPKGVTFTISELVKKNGLHQQTEVLCTEIVVNWRHRVGDCVGEIKQTRLLQQRLMDQCGSLSIHPRKHYFHFTNGSVVMFNMF